MAAHLYIIKGDTAFIPVSTSFLATLLTKSSPSPLGILPTQDFNMQFKLILPLITLLSGASASPSKVFKGLADRSLELPRGVESFSPGSQTHCNGVRSMSNPSGFKATSDTSYERNVLLVAAKTAEVFVKRHPEKSTTVVREAWYVSIMAGTRISCANSLIPVR